jgi:hypothetical protein
MGSGARARDSQSWSRETLGGPPADYAASGKWSRTLHVQNRARRRVAPKFLRHRSGAPQGELADRKAGTCSFAGARSIQLRRAALRSLYWREPTSAPSFWERHRERRRKTPAGNRSRDRVSMPRRSGGRFAVRACEQAKRWLGCLTMRYSLRLILRRPRSGRLE